MTQEEKNVKPLEFGELVKGLQEQAILKKDFVVPSNCMEMKNGKLAIINHTDENQALTTMLRNTGIAVPNDMIGERIELEPLEVCHAHLSEKLGIPKRYYDKMLTGGHSNLLDKNVTHWLKANGEVGYLVRTFIDPIKKTGIARALLSDRFLTLDNYDVLLAVLEAIRNAGIPPDFFKIEGNITDKGFYARFSVPSIEVDAPNLLKQYRVPNGDNSKTGIIAGFIITNSEVGFRRFTISPRAVILRCNNGLTFIDDAFNQVHLGSQMEKFTEIKWSEDTKRKNYELIMSQVGDCIRQYVSPEYIGAKIAKLERLASEELEHPIDTVQNVCTSLGVSDEKQKSILDYFVKGADTSPFGVMNAITYYAHKNANPDEQYDLEAQAMKMADKMKKEHDRPFIRDKKTGQLEVPVISAN